LPLVHREVWGMGGGEEVDADHVGACRQSQIQGAFVDDVGQRLGRWTRISVGVRPDWQAIAIVTPVASTPPASFASRWCMFAGQAWARALAIVRLTRYHLLRSNPSQFCPAEY
jgi:hypothetical protein